MLESEPVEFSLAVDETKAFELDNSTDKKITITLNEITNGGASLTMTHITEGPPPLPQDLGGWLLIYVSVAAVGVLMALAAVVLHRRGNKNAIQPQPIAYS